MNFGFSAGDIATVVNVAWRAYSGWKRACGEYSEVTTSLDILFTHLERIQEETEEPDSVLLRSTKDRRDLQTILASCEPTIRDLDGVLRKYKNLGRSRQSNWERLRFGIKNLDDLQKKLTRHNAEIAAFT